MLFENVGYLLHKFNPIEKSKPSSTNKNIADPEKEECQGRENGIYGGIKQIGGGTKPISENRQIGGGPKQIGGTKSISESKQVGGTTSISGQIVEMERDGGSTCAAASHLPLSRPNKR